VQIAEPPEGIPVMTVTAQYPPPQMNQETRQLVDAVVRQMVAGQQTGGGARDFGPPAQGAAGGGAPAQTAQPAQGGQDAQRFFGGILSGIVEHVLPKVATTVLGLLQQRRRDLGLPEQRDTAGVERDLGSILSALLPKLVDAIPSIAAAISGQPAPRSPQEESERFFPFLAALIPAALSAVGPIIQSFNQQRGVDAPAPSITDPDVAERFIGPLLSSFVPQLLQSAPSIFASLFGGGGRGVAANAW